jgi:hypothetical protein
MNWTLKGSSGPINHWILANDSSLIAELKYNRESNSFRLDAEDKRLFFLEKTGVLQKKMLLKTEYNVIAGEAHFIRNEKAGIILLEDSRLSFSMKDAYVYLLKKHKNIEHFFIDQMDKLKVFEFTSLLFSLVRIHEHHAKSHSKLMIA